MYKNIAESNVRKGDFFMLFTKGERLKKYLTAILIALPNWFVIGILISFSNKFALLMKVKGAIDPGKAIMVAYAAIAVGDVLIGFISQWVKSRKVSLYIFHLISIIGTIWFFNLQGQDANMMYWVCVILGFGTGFWAMFVTMAAEQFGTNIRATVATTVPNMARGSLVLVTWLFRLVQGGLPAEQAYFKGAWITGIIVFVIAIISLIITPETYGKDLNYIEQ
jgi:putative MFS transporter